MEDARTTPSEEVVKELQYFLSLLDWELPEETIEHFIENPHSIDIPEHLICFALDSLGLQEPWEAKCFWTLHFSLAQLMMSERLKQKKKGYVTSSLWPQLLEMIREESSEEKIHSPPTPPH